jgi:hypothetical protein
MNLLERLQNTAFTLVEEVVLQLFFYGKQKEIYETAFPSSETFRPFWEKVKHGISMVRKISLNLNYSNFVFCP